MPLRFDNIDSCDVTKDMVYILVFTDANHDKEVRERAVAKVKTNPLWQQEICRLLENNGAVEAFTFLASNDVEDKNLFVQPVNTGLLSIAEWIKRQIKNASHPSNFYAEEFSWEVERALRTAEKFEGLGTDYIPAVREMRAALDEVASVKKIEFKCALVLDNWIKKRDNLNR